MSAGNTLVVGYESYYDVGGIYPLRIQPESASASIGETSNSPPASPINRIVSAKVGGSKRKKGVLVRLIYLKIALGFDPPPDYSLTSRTAIPALTESFYKLAITTGELVYLDTTWKVTGGRPEYIN